MSEYTTPDGETIEITFASALNDLRVSLEAVASRVRGEPPSDESFPPRTSSRAGKKDSDAVALPDGTSIDAAQLVQELACIIRDIAEAPSAAPKKAARKTKAKGGGDASPPPPPLTDAECAAIIPLAGNQDGDVAFGTVPDPGDGGQARFFETSYGGGGDATIREDGGYVLLPQIHQQQGGYELQQPPIYVTMPAPQQQGGYELQQPPIYVPAPVQQQPQEARGGGPPRAVHNNNNNESQTQRPVPTGGSVRVVNIPAKYGGVMPDPIPPRSVGF